MGERGEIIKEEGVHLNKGVLVGCILHYFKNKVFH